MVKKQTTIPVPTGEHRESLTPKKYQEIVKDPDFFVGAWRDEALCDDLVNSGQISPNIFFPADHGPGSSDKVPKQALWICNACPVRLECLSYALLTNQSKGVWAGLSELKRRKIRARLFEALGKRP